jgi:hypothetical protein
VAAIIFVGAAQVGCGADSPTASTALAGLMVTAGNDQLCWPGGTLPLQLRVQAVDGSGRPVAVAGIPVTWRVQSGDGAIDPAGGVTDPQGQAVAQWTLGPGEGVQTASAQAEGGASALFTARAAEPGPLLGVSWELNQGGSIFVMDEVGGNSDGTPVTPEGRQRSRLVAGRVPNRLCALP